MRRSEKLSSRNRAMSFLKFGTALGVVAFVVGVEAVGGQENPGRQAYVDVGCGGCHGPSARGGIGSPAMVPMNATGSEFARSFYEAMPGFEVTDEQLSLIYTYLIDLTNPSADAGPIGSGSADDASGKKAPASDLSERNWAPGRATDAQALRESVAQYVAAWDSGDAKTLSELFTTDAERILINGEHVTGRAAIEKQFAESFLSRPASDAATIAPVSFHFLTANVAVTHGTWLITSGFGGTNSGRYMNLFVKRGDEWLVFRSMMMRPTEP